MKNSIMCLALILAIPLMAFAMPPHDRVIEMIKSGQIEKPEFMGDPQFFKDRGIDQGKPRRLAALDNPTGQFKALAILVTFSDHPSQVAPTYFDNLIFGTTGNTVKDFYSEVSYETLDIITVNLPSSLGWRTMPQTYAYYVDGDNGFGTYPHNAQRLTEDAVWAVNSSVDFSQYDNDNDGTVDALFIIHTGPGAEYTGNVNDIWSHAWSCVLDPYVDGVWVNSYSMEPEYWVSPGDMTCGVYSHELGHVFGLPDLYDYGYDSRGLGKWSVMAGGSWNGTRGDSPAHLDAWCRCFLGFADWTNVTTALTAAPLPAVENTGTIYRMWTNGGSGTEFFLVENRQRTGFDASLPAAGLHIYHIDETQSGNDHQWYPGYTSDGHYKVALEQSDGDWDLEQDINSGDTGDPYPGLYVNRTFDGSSTPDSKNYAGNVTYVAVTNISNSGSNMTADLSVANAPAAPSPVAPANGSYTNNRRPLFDFSSSTGATVYHIQIDDNSNFSSPVYDINNLTSSQYTPSSNLSDAVYYWRSRAGNGLAWSAWSSTWVVTIDATAPGAPINLTANGYNPSHWTSNPTFSINWSNPSDLSGIQKALYKLGNAPAANFDTTGSFQLPPPRSITISTQGGQNLYLWFLDNAGNINRANAGAVMLNFDNTRPAGCLADSPDTTSSLSFRLSWSRGTDSGGSGVASQFDIWYRIDLGAWNQLYNDRADTMVMFTGLHGHLYSFEALNTDNAGNIEIRNAVAESRTFIDTTWREINYFPGDANNNGDVNGIDVVFLVNYLKGLGPGPYPYLCGDANGSCDVNGLDVTYLVNYLKGIGQEPFLGYCP